MKSLFTFLLMFLLGGQLLSQELKCVVSVVSREIQGTNKQVFQTMQNAIYEFMNSTVWTNHIYDIDERIECNFLININQQVSADEFKGTMQIQASRPVFNSNVNSTLFNYKDEDIHFRYMEFEPLEFSENTHLSNLTSILAFYVYIILGLDYDSFSDHGGTPYFRKAENIVSNAQSVAERGWRAVENRKHSNRYWLVKDILDEDYEPLRDFMYKYHRHGLDKMDKSANEARTAIAEHLKLLQEIFRRKPDPYMHVLSVILNAKSDEFVNIFSEGFPQEKSRVVQILTEIDPSNASKYEKIQKGGG